MKEPKRIVGFYEGKGIGCESHNEKLKMVALLGFSSYEEYLNSDLWAWIRSQLMLDSRSTSCRVCQSTSGLCWHHRDYSVAILAGNFSSTNDRIVRLCGDCHRAIHFEAAEWIEDLHVVDDRLWCLWSRFADNRFSMRDKLPTDSSELDGFQEFINPGGF